jgi:hypothetical protein
MYTKKIPAPNGRRHGLRARLAVAARDTKTVLTFASGAQTYHWTTDRGRSRVVIKH